jgi:hypothetical protein
MYHAHASFRREFGLLPALVRSASAGDAEHALTAVKHMKLLSGLLHHHHSAEDRVLWPLLLTRAPKEIDPVVHLVEEQHRGVEDMLEEVDQRLEAGADSVTGTGGEAFAQALQRLAVALYEHMHLEERLVLPVVARHVFASEWDTMTEGIEDTLTPDIAPILFGMTLYETDMKAVSPRIPQVMLELAPKAYAAYAERLHGTPSPPRSTDLVLSTPDIRVIAHG